MSDTRTSSRATKRTVGIAAAATTAVIFTATSAAAAVTIDETTGTGFVGKGDVQTFMGWNDKQLQERAAKVGAMSFSRSVSQLVSQTGVETSTQLGTETVTQPGTQTATQSVTETVVQTVSCEIEQAQVTHTRHGYRDGSRIGSATGSRTGTRDASRPASRTNTRTSLRTGTQTGTETAQIAYDTRKQSQGKNGPITGFNLTGWVAGSRTTAWSADSPWTTTSYGAWSYGDWTGSGDYGYGDWEWSAYSFDAPVFTDGYTFEGWDSDPTANPASCLGGNPHVTNLSDVVTVTGTAAYADPVESEIVPGTLGASTFTAAGDPSGSVDWNGAVVPGAITHGAYSITGITLVN